MGTSEWWPSIGCSTEPPRPRPGSRPSTWVGLFLLLAGLLPLATPISGQSLRSFSLSIENDGFVFWNPPHERTDWYYTHGLRADAVLGWTPRFLNGALGVPGRVCGRSGQASGAFPCGLTRVGVTQAIYTPARLFTKNPPLDDRPYAGWLALEATALRWEPRRSSLLGLELGVTGKPSYAAAIHRWFHRYLGKFEPQGWQHQIPFELAFALKYETRRSIALVEALEEGFLRIEPRGGASLGTLRTGATGGITVEGGWNAPPFLDLFGAKPESAYLLVGVDAEGELVLRDLFLDGSTWGRSVAAERVPAIGRLTGRVQAGWSGLGIEFSATRTSVQFTGQDGSHVIGTVRFIFRR